MPDLDPRLNAYRPDLADAALEGRVAAARFTAGRAAQVARGVAALRRRPDAESPLDTQLLSGEAVTVFDEADGWAWVQNRTDGYVGYLESAALGAQSATLTHSVQALRSFLFPGPDLKLPPLDALTMSGRVAVTGADGAYSRVTVGGREGWVYSRHLAPESDIAPDFVATALRFLGVPYLWGGKESGGIDCSGLIQVALARAGIPCPRDSALQAENLGVAVALESGRAEFKRGDLIYFPGHCAIALNSHEVINANAHAMMVSIEPLEELVVRVKEESGGTGITGVRRL